ncbi:hypothetical protein J2X72_004353 [Phyllobacterium sp. 1468]|uniref:hypothetical protein n=1 Tax=Phyllobacterium sp. 1468 TaxID=2817759 RepID=UPI002856C8D5|nr:hypothetical protein [Phyllobacterium sp. 1468]MDR6635539.1 hypothetical protein [Phyllobacterium sp. 1468]
MAFTDNTSKQGYAERAKVAGGEKYGVDYLMKTLNLGRDDAAQLIAKYNGNREKIEAEVYKRRPRKTFAHL